MGPRIQIGDLPNALGHNTKQRDEKFRRAEYRRQRKVRDHATERFPHATEAQQRTKESYREEHGTSQNGWRTHDAYQRHLQRKPWQWRRAMLLRTHLHLPLLLTCSAWSPSATRGRASSAPPSFAYCRPGNLYVRLWARAHLFSCCAPPHRRRFVFHAVAVRFTVLVGRAICS